MKKLFLLLLLSGTIATYGQNFFGLKTPEKYEHILTYFFARPVSLDSAKVSPKKAYPLEGFKRKSSGDSALIPIIVFVEGAMLQELLRLVWPTSLNVSATFPGKGFTANPLGKKSFLSKKEIADTSRFDPQQREILERDKNVEKFVLRSALPIEVCGKINGDIFVLTDCNSTTTKKPRYQ